MHLREKEIVERVVPQSIVIGPFFVSTSKLREALSSKRKMLAEAVLNYQTRKVRNKAEEVNNSFRDIQRKLFEKPNNMEELHEHREWMKSIPGLLEDKKVRKYHQHQLRILNLIFYPKEMFRTNFKDYTIFRKKYFFFSRHHKMKSLNIVG